MVDTKIQVSKDTDLPITLGVQALINDTALCQRMDTVVDDLDRIIAEIQRAIVSPANRDTVGPTLLALAMVNDSFKIFTSRGRAAKKLQDQPPAKKN